MLNPLHHDTPYNLLYKYCQIKAHIPESITYVFRISWKDFSFFFFEGSISLCGLVIGIRRFVVDFTCLSQTVHDVLFNLKKISLKMNTLQTCIIYLNMKIYWFNCHYVGKSDVESVCHFILWQLSKRLFEGCS